MISSRFRLTTNLFKKATSLQVQSVLRYRNTGVIATDRILGPFSSLFPDPPKKLAESKLPKVNTLSDTLTEDLRQELVGNATTKKFRLKELESNLQYWEELRYPMPEKLTFEQWKQLLSYQGFFARLYYLDAVNDGQDQDPEVLEQLVNVDSETFGPMKVDQEVLERLIGDDPELKDSWELVLYDYDKMQLNGQNLCSRPTEDEIKELLTCTSQRARMGALKFIQMKRIQDLKDHVARRVTSVIGPILKKQHKDTMENEKHIAYGLGHNTIFHRVYPASMDFYNNHRAIQEFHEWGNQLVIDLSFKDTLPVRQQKSLAFRELQFALKFNRESRQPFAMHFTNYDFNCEMLKKSFPRAQEPDFPIMATEKSYMDLFPRENLVYLSPDSRNDLTYNPEDIYIIGGLVDMHSNAPLSLSSAKKLGIRHARFPMKRTLGFTAALNVEHCVAILSDYVRTRDWFYAFRWVPSRYFRNRLKSGVVTGEMEQAYLTHKELYPDSFEHPNSDLSPAEYRRRYRARMATVPKGVFVEPTKYTNRVRERHRQYYELMTS